MDPKTPKRTQFSEHKQVSREVGEHHAALPNTGKAQTWTADQHLLSHHGNVRNGDASEREQERRSVSEPVVSRNSILPIIIVGFNK